MTRFPVYFKELVIKIFALFLAQQMIFAGTSAYSAFGPAPGQPWSWEKGNALQGRTVFYLQDAHESLSAQKQIAQKIYELVKTGRIRTVIFEGAPRGPVFAEDFKLGAPPGRIENAALEFLKQGKIGAAEYAFLAGPEPFRLFGAEKAEDYRTDLKHFRYLLAHRDRTLRTLSNLRRDLESARMNFEKAQTKQTADQLINALNDPHPDLIRWVKSISPIIKSERFSIKNYPEFDSLEKLLASDEKFQIPYSGFQIISSLENLIWNLRLKLAGNEKEKEWVKKRFQFELARKFCMGEMTSGEEKGLSKNAFEKYKPLAGVMRAAKLFYDYAHRRSLNMAESIIQYLSESGDEAVVVIAGGFHGEEMKNYISSRGADFQAWSPSLISENDYKIDYRKNMTGNNHIRIESPFKPMTSRALKREFLAAFRKQSGIPEGKILERRRAEWVHAASLGSAQETVTGPASFSEIFKGILLGKNFADSSGKLILKVKQSGAEYALNPDVPQKLNTVIPSLFDQPSLGQFVLGQYHKITDAFYVDLDQPVVHADLMLFAMMRTMKLLNQYRTGILNEKANFLRAALKPGADAIRCQGHVDRPVLAGYQYDGSFAVCSDVSAWSDFWGKPNKFLNETFLKKMGKEFPAKSRKPLSESERKSLMEERRRERGRSIYRTSSSNAREGKVTYSYFPQGEISPEKVEKVLSEMEREIALAAEEIQKAEREIIPIYRGHVRKIWQLREQSVPPGPSKFSLLEAVMKGFKSRFKNSFFPLYPLKHLLLNYRSGKPMQMDDEAENLEESFLLSGAALICEPDETGRIINWNDLLIAYIRQTAETKSFSLRYEPFPDPGLSGEEKKKFLQFLWDMHFPVAKGNSLGMEETRRLREWDAYFAFVPEKEDRGILAADQLPLAGAVLSRPLNPFEISESFYNYVILAPGGKYAVNPFLKLQNPTRQTVVVRIDFPGSAREKAKILTDPLEKAALLSWLMTSSSNFKKTNPLVLTPEGLVEVDRLDPIRRIKDAMAISGAFFSKVKKIEDLERMKPDSISRSAKEFDVTGLQEPEIPENREKPARILKIKDSAQPIRLIQEIIQGVADYQPKKIGDLEIIHDSKAGWESARSKILENLPPDLNERYAFESADSSSGFTVRAKKQPYFINFSADTVTFNINAGPNRHPQHAIGGPEKILGFTGVGRYILASVTRYLLAQKLEGLDKKIFDRWEPFLIRLYQDLMKEEGGRFAGASSLGAANALSIEQLVLGERRVKENFHRNFAVDQAAGPYELFVFWDALRRGILVNELAGLLASVPNLRVTVVDDRMKGSEISSRLLSVDARKRLLPFIVKGQLVIPSDGKLEKELKEARNRLKKTYSSNYQSFLGVVFSDDEPEKEEINFRQMALRAPDAERFLVEGKVNLGVIARAIMALIDGNPRDYFDLKENTWTLLPASEVLLASLLETQKAQLALQLSA